MLDCAFLRRQAYSAAMELDLSLRTASAVAVVLLVVLTVLCCKRSRKRVYLLDFACYKPPPSLYFSMDMTSIMLMNLLRASGATEQEIEDGHDFQKRVLLKNGLRPVAAGPPAMHREGDVRSLETAREEARLVMFSAVREVLGRTGIQPKDIDFLVVNCSLFNPTPSLSAMVMNHFKMRSDVISYNLAGMGCSAGIISIDLAQRLLKESPNKYALVVSTENVTLQNYNGKVRSMQIPNTLFRMGAAAILLTNRPGERRRAKYELEHVVRVNLAADDAAFECVYQKEDADGHRGVDLNKDLVKVAAKALEKNLTRLAPLVLPWSELGLYGYDAALRRLGLRHGPGYTPKFSRAFQHFIIHAGGRAVVEGIGGQLGLTKANLAPSFSALYWFGNTSSSSYWYGFGFAESKQGMRRGDKVWQIGFGSGFKTNSAVWRALRTFRDDRHHAWADVGAAEIEGMWRALEGMGTFFVDDRMPTPAEKKQMQAAAAAAAAAATAGGAAGACLPKSVLKAAQAHDQTMSGTSE